MHAGGHQADRGRHRDDRDGDPDERQRARRLDSSGRNVRQRRSHGAAFLRAQAAELLPGSISDNIARFESEIDPETVIRAAEAAGVHELIVSLPGGYQTVVGENGASLSAGQVQRIALARALYHEPFLVVLDEPNSNLDAEGEAALTRAVFRVRERGGIVVIIAHHPSVLAAVDTLLVMRGGRMWALGPKDEILPKVLRPVSATTAPLRVVGDATRTAS